MLLLVLVSDYMHYLQSVPHSLTSPNQVKSYSSVTEDYLLYDLIYRRFIEKTNCRNGNTLVVT